MQVYDSIRSGRRLSTRHDSDTVFESRGIRQKELPLFADNHLIKLAPKPLPPVIQRIKNERFFDYDGNETLHEILHNHETTAPTVDYPPTSGMSAGKNTYTYDAHTYHTKVPPQGIAELLKHYLPQGGVVLDPFAGSGMTGVAARMIGYDCILNELSPAACFIANQFTSYIEPTLFKAGLRTIFDETREVRRILYTTHHRQSGQEIEFEYVVWSYRVICNFCSTEFTLWDQCRKYGRNVREHKILSEFPCPSAIKN